MATKPIPGSLKLPNWVKEWVPPELVESTLFQFDILLRVEEMTADGPRRKKITVNLLPNLDLDYEILESQMQDLPSIYAFFSAVYSEVRMNAELVERAIKARKGHVMKTIVTDTNQQKVRFTADQIKIIIEADESLSALDTKYQSLQMQVGKLYHLLEALKMKAELSRSLAGFKRNESAQS